MSSTAKKKYELTDEHRAQLKPWADKWIANGLSIKPMDDYDKEQMLIAINGLYESAGFKKPKKIVFVPSPMVARFAGGFASAILSTKRYEESEKGIRDATYATPLLGTRKATSIETLEKTHGETGSTINSKIDSATNSAIANATSDAPIKALLETAIDKTSDTTGVVNMETFSKTSSKISKETSIDTISATYEATYNATYQITTWIVTNSLDTATNSATKNNPKKEKVDKHRWYTSIEGFIQAGKDLGVGKKGFEEAQKAWRLYQGGNFWSGSCCYISFFKDVVKLDLDYSKYEFWEKACLHGSYRIMHKDFCIVSDRPRKLLLDDTGRSHCEDGPYIEWSDGTGLYSWHGVRVPEWFIMNKEALTPEIALKWENIEQRRAACEILGWGKILNELNAVSINKDVDPEIGELLEVEIPDIGKEKFLKVVCGTGRTFALPVPPDMKTALQANAWTYDIPENLFKPEFRT